MPMTTQHPKIMIWYFSGPANLRSFVQLVDMDPALLLVCINTAQYNHTFDA